MGMNLSQVQQQLIIGDDTAVNGIRLHCAKCNPPHDEEVITSSFAPWGNWTETLWCDFGFLTKFMMRVEDSKPRRDNTAVNNIKFMCSDGKVLEGKGLSWGSYGTWSESCVHGIRGLKTKVQGLVPDDDKDNTGLNDSQFLCGE
ncbi:vitelline membrane outer layer protein 1 homolog [Mixophyes fleayi]|uniref:vitelline membrane outer layer protein 1 homolog n=1 Tax=Mixophyes fleayi TaxID=3061075 RepID=UPI003F4E10AE